MAGEKSGRQLLVGWLVVVVSMPGALGLETLVRHYLLPPDFEFLRQLWQPYLTPLVWGLLPLCLLSTWAAFRLYRWMRGRALAAATPTEVVWKRFEAMMVSTSVAQSPGLVAVFAAMAGAGFAAVASVVGASTLGVLAMGVLLAPDLSDPQPQ